jgi:hypothetical protein
MSILLNLFIAFDQVVNCCVKIKGDGWGKPDETLSARAYRLRDKSDRAYKYINKVFFWQADHCKEAYDSEIERKHLPSDYHLI